MSTSSSLPSPFPRVKTKNQRAVLTAFTYLVLSIIPLVSLLLGECSHGGTWRDDRGASAARCITKTGGDAEWSPFLQQTPDGGIGSHDGLAIDPVTGVLVVAPGNGRRLTRDEAAIIRAALAQGCPIQFADRHQWRHFEVRHPSA